MDTYSNLVEKATSEYLIQPDWTINIQICDQLCHDSSGCMNVSRLVAKRINQKKSRVSMFALELTEALVKNCENMHPFIGGKEFQAELIKFITNKKIKDDVREKALELVQFWNDSFSARRDLPLFVQTYQTLRRTGMKFPPRRADEAPLVFKNAPKTAPAHVQSVNERIHSTGARPRGNSGASSNPPTNRDHDFVALRETLNLTLELLAFCDPEQEDPASNDILNDMLKNCKESQANVRTSIETGNFTSDGQMMTLISLNEDLLKAQEMYDDLVTRRSNFLKFGPRQPAPPPQQSSATNLIDLSDAFGGISIQPPSSAPSSSSSYAPPPSSYPYPYSQQPAPTSSHPPPASTPSYYAPTNPPYNAPSNPPYNPASNPNYTNSSASAYPPSNYKRDEFDFLAQRPGNTTVPISSGNAYVAPPPASGNSLYAANRPSGVQPTSGAVGGGYTAPTPTNPFYGGNPAPAPAKPVDPFDEFDLLAQRRSGGMSRPGTSTTAPAGTNPPPSAYPPSNTSAYPTTSSYPSSSYNTSSAFPSSNTSAFPPSTNVPPVSGPQSNASYDYAQYLASLNPTASSGYSTGSQQMNVNTTSSVGYSGQANAYPPQPNYSSGAQYNYGGYNAQGPVKK